MLIEVSQSTVEPLTLAEAKAHLRVDFADDDAYIFGLITAARQLIESEADTCLVATTWQENLAAFPDRNTLTYGLNLYFYWQLYKRKLKLTKYPVTAVASVQYYDANDNLQTLDPDTYVVSLPTNGVAWIEPLIYWPITYVRPDAVQINYTAQNTVNTALVKACMKLIIGNWYEHREQDNEVMMTALPLGVNRLMAQIDRRGYQ